MAWGRHGVTWGRNDVKGTRNGVWGIPLAPLRFAKGGFPSQASPAVLLRWLASPYAEAKGTGARVRQGLRED